VAVPSSNVYAYTESYFYENGTRTMCVTGLLSNLVNFSSIQLKLNIEIEIQTD